jgi:DNA-directed RNA polymerase specialized sigma24 family protein
LRLTHDRHLAEDAVQEAMIEIWNMASTWGDEKSTTLGFC